jgi:hypothetical protein
VGRIDPAAKASLRVLDGRERLRSVVFPVQPDRKLIRPHGLRGSFESVTSRVVHRCTMMAAFHSSSRACGTICNAMRIDAGTFVLVNKAHHVEAAARGSAPKRARRGTPRENATAACTRGRGDESSGSA